MAYYPKDEQETVIVYESETGEWDVYTTVPKHVRRLENCAIGSISRVEKDSEGFTIALRIKVDKLPYASLFNR